MRKSSDSIQNIGSLFDKYRKRLKAPQKTVINTFQEVVADLFGIHIDEKDCGYTVSNRMFRLNVSGPFKTEILMRKKEVLLHMKGRLGEKSTPKEII
ncbi:hypothetical protein OAD26_00350 [bacterium]|nr:hypothetical protein [bacterium]